MKRFPTRLSGRRGILWSGVVLGWLLGVVTGPTVRAGGPDDLLSSVTRLMVDVRGSLTPMTGYPLAWAIHWTESSGNSRQGEVTVQGEGVSVVVNVAYNMDTGGVSWRVREARVDLGIWGPILAMRPEVASSLRDVKISGVLILSGAGAMEAEGWTGSWQAQCKDARFQNDVQGWSIDGMDIRIGGEVADLLRGSMSIDLAACTISTSRLGARNFSAQAVLTERSEVKVNLAQIEVAGGNLRADTFTFSLSQPCVRTGITMREVGLQDLIVFVPEVFSEARGRISGRVDVSWDPVDGVAIGGGALALDSREATVVRMIPNPGFLTRGVSERVGLLPLDWGVVSRWVSGRNEAYYDLKKIELGQVDLRVVDLNVMLTPGGDLLRRSASAVIRARPEQEGSTIGMVTFSINVFGPLSSVMTMGAKQGLSVESP